MTAADRHSPFRLLTRHFFAGFFRLSFLDAAGEASFVRALLGVLSAIIVLGLAMARLYAVKYGELAALPTPARYLAMLPADQLTMITLPMLIVGFIMALVSHSLFPDDLDFRILLALPVTRRTVFLAKAAATAMFAGIFVTTTTLMIGVPFVLISHGRWAPHGLGRRLLAQMVTGFTASTFVVIAIAAVQGLVILSTPRRWRQPALTALQTLLVCEAVLALPFVLRLPRIWRTLADSPSWLLAAAPAWFLGVDRTLAGDANALDRQLALAAVAGTIALCAIAASCYFVIYRRFDRLSLQPIRGAQRRWRPWSPRRQHPAQAAVRSFIGATLRRSSLHQLAVTGAFTAGLALAVNGVLLNLSGRDRWIERAAAMAPLLAIIVSTLGLRGAFLTPTNLRAAWIFKFTERTDCRIPQLNAVRAALMARGVILPMLAVWPLQAAFLGPGVSLAAMPITFAIGWLLVELVTYEWRRIPFTCTVLFAKRPMAQTLLMALMLYFVFGFIGTTIVQAALSHWVAWLGVMTVLTAIAACARLLRAQTWGQYPLEFEDYLPDGLDTLQL